VSALRRYKDLRDAGRVREAWAGLPGARLLDHMVEWAHRHPERTTIERDAIQAGITRANRALERKHTARRISDNLTTVRHAYTTDEDLEVAVSAARAASRPAWVSPGPGPWVLTASAHDDAVTAAVTLGRMPLAVSLRLITPWSTVVPALVDFVGGP
jgi:hypothetical protein